MSRYDSVNALARAWATPTFGAGPRVQEWEVRMFPEGAAANTVYYASRRDAQNDMTREERRGVRCEGPYPAARR